MLAEGLRLLVERNGGVAPDVLQAKGRQFMQDRDEAGAPPPTLSGDPERDLEQKLRREPGNDDAKVDVGSDESMDASDPPSSSQPGCSDEPVPSSGFPAGS
jgi:hypothetical protein